MSPDEYAAKVSRVHEVIRCERAGWYVLYSDTDLARVIVAAVHVGERVDAGAPPAATS